MPVGLGYDGNLVSVAFERSADDGNPERGMVDIGIARKQDDVGLLPTAQQQFLLGGGKPVGELQRTFFQDGFSSVGVSVDGTSAGRSFSHC